MKVTLDEALKRYDRDSWFNKGREKYVYSLVKDFVKDFPMDKIKDITLEDYLISKDGGAGKSDSFCRRLRYELEVLCHMGNVHFDVFGIYLNGGTVITLSKTFKNIYGDNYKAAFEGIKDEIVRLLTDFANKNYEGVNSNRLNWSFKDKLLCIYFPDKYFPVCTSNVLTEYHERIGLFLPKNMQRALKNKALLDHMKKHPVFAKTSHFQKMSFCDYIWRENLNVSLQNEANYKITNKTENKNPRSTSK